MPLLLWAAIVPVALFGVIQVDSLLGMLIWRHPAELGVQYYQSEASKPRYLSLVFPGFSNPWEPFGRGMAELLLKYGPMYLVHYGRAISFGDIYRAIMEMLGAHRGKHQIIVYGHSMGGDIGVMFAKAYEDSGSPFGPISIIFLDCSPWGRKTVRSPFPGAATLARWGLSIWRGGPLLSLFIAIGNLISRITMPSRPDGVIGPDIMKPYKRGIMWFNPISWRSHLLHLLRRNVSTAPILTKADVVYIGAEEPKRDQLVDQPAAITACRRNFPSMKVVLHSAIGHAWPLEQHRVYDRIIEAALIAREERMQV